jgi:hypothetical protein
MKFVKWILIIAAAFALLFYFVAMPYMQDQTKKHSPQRTASYTKNGLEVVVNYSSPFKKDRIIFGELVPYGQVWRTGANEPTVFTTKTNITVIDQELPAGTYSLWTIPNEQHWKVIFNSDVPEWGVTLSSGGTETTRNPDFDIIVVEVPTETLSNTAESFTIAFENDGQLYLTLAWDQTKVSVPINP